MADAQERSESRRRAIEEAAYVVPNSWHDITRADAVLMTVQIIEAFERAMRARDDPAA